MGQSGRIALDEAERQLESIGFETITKTVKPMNNAERLNALYKKFELTEDDYFKHHHYTIITRSGIDKIQVGSKIRIEYNLLYHSEDLKRVVIKAVGTTTDRYVESFGEASPENNKNSYPIAMAEKRAMSRVVLKIAGFYELGAFGEDEAEDFKRK